jgi:hypothetical protein
VPGSLIADPNTARVTADPKTAGAAGAADRLREVSSRAPFATALAACTVLALLSAAVLPTVPSYDPWSWVVWGRELSDPHLSFVVNGGPSWKPLPFLFTSVYGLFGGAAPTLWVITARVGGLMAFVAAYRLGATLLGRLGYARVAPMAGVVAAASLVLTQDWAYYSYRGASEPMLVGCALWSVDRLIARRYWEAFWLGVALGLMRPEAWPFMIVYGTWIAWKTPTVRARATVVAGLLLMPFLWFGPPGISTGQPFLAATHAHDYNGHLGAHPFLEVMRRGVDDTSVPILVLALIGLAITAYRERDRLILAVSAGAAAWWVIVVAMTLDGYPGLERFFLPAAALTCVMAGVGVVRLGALVGEIASGGPGAGRVSRPAAVLAAVAAIAISYVFVDGRVSYTGHQYTVANHAVTRLDRLSDAVAAVGGHRGVYPCRTSFAAVNHSVQTALAWKLHVTLERVGTSMRHPGVLFIGPHDSIDGGEARIDPGLNRIVLIKRVGPWRMYRVYRAGHSLSCVGI